MSKKMKTGTKAGNQLVTNVYLSKNNYNPKDVILSTLYAAEGNAVTRYKLSKTAKISDRQLRRYIGELREEGHMIGQAINGGYSINNIDDLKRTIDAMEAKARTEHRRIRKMKKAIEHQNQLVMGI